MVSVAVVKEIKQETRLSAVESPESFMIVEWCG